MLAVQSLQAFMLLGLWCSQAQVLQWVLAGLTDAFLDEVPSPTAAALMSSFVAFICAAGQDTGAFRVLVAASL